LSIAKQAAKRKYTAKERDGSSKRVYHHGNLREALIFAAIGLIADKGLQGSTFAEATRAVGVFASCTLPPFPRS